jgi:hypothetical protein
MLADLGYRGIPADHRHDPFIKVVKWGAWCAFDVGQNILGCPPSALLISSETWLPGRGTTPDGAGLVRAAAVQGVRQCEFGGPRDVSRKNREGGPETEGLIFSPEASST